MNYESKAIKTYHDLMILSCVLVAVGGIVLAFMLSREYHSFSFTYGGYYETNAVTLITYLLVTVLVTAVDYAVCQVTCEFFNNVCIIANKVKSEAAAANETSDINEDVVVKEDNEEADAASVDTLEEADKNDETEN